MKRTVVLNNSKFVIVILGFLQNWFYTCILVLTSPTLKGESSHGLSGFPHPSFDGQSRGAKDLLS